MILNLDIKDFTIQKTHLSSLRIDTTLLSISNCECFFVIIKIWSTNLASQVFVQSINKNDFYLFAVRFSSIISVTVLQIRNFQANVAVVNESLISCRPGY